MEEIKEIKQPDNTAVRTALWRAYICKAGKEQLTVSIDERIILSLDF